MIKALLILAATLCAGCVLMPAGMDTLGRITLSSSRTQADIVFQPKHHGFGFDLRQDTEFKSETQRVRVVLTNLGSQPAEVGTSRWRNHDTLEGHQRFHLPPGVRVMVNEGPLSRCAVSVLHTRGSPRKRPVNLRVELEPASPLQQEVKLVIKASWGNP